MIVQLVHDLSNFRLADELVKMVSGMSDLMVLIVVLVHNLVVVLIDDVNFDLVVVKIAVVMFEGMDCIKQFLVITIECIGVHLQVVLVFEGYIACKLVAVVLRLVDEHHFLEYLPLQSNLQLVVLVVVDQIVGEYKSSFVVEVTKNNPKLDEGFLDVVRDDDDVVVVVVEIISVVVDAEVVAI